MVPSAEKPTQTRATATAPPAPPTSGLTPHEPSPYAGGPGSPPDPPKRPTGGSGGGGGSDGSGGGDPGDEAARKRLTWIVAGVGILALVILFVVLQSSSTDDGTTASTPADFPVATQSQAKAAAAATNPTQPTVNDPSLPSASTPESTPATTAPATSAAGGGVAVPSDESTTPAPADVGPVLTAGSVTKIKAKQGDTVAFQVKSKTAQEVHVHGYDKKYELAAGETKDISFKATITGIFEIEFEDTATQIGELTIEP